MTPPGAGPKLAPVSRVVDERKGGLMATKRSTPGTREIRVAVSPQTNFRALVKALEQTLVVPKIPGVRGCNPCLSGLDRFVIESSILERVSG